MCLTDLIIKRISWLHLKHAVTGFCGTRLSAAGALGTASRGKGIGTPYVESNLTLVTQYNPFTQEEGKIDAETARDQYHQNISGWCTVTHK